MKRTFVTLPRALACAAAAVACAASACTPSDPTRAVQVEGELGNGGFLFLCDDSVQCEKTASDVSKFPRAISLGATFNVRYKLSADPAAIKIYLSDSSPDRGIVVAPATGAPSASAATKYQYLSSGPDGLVAIKAGYATLVARDTRGAVVDYITVKLQKPDDIAVYKAEDKSSPPPRVSTVSLTTGENASFRAVAQRANQDLGGALRVEWTSDTPSVVSVDGVSGVKVTLTANAPGTAVLTATAAGFEKKISVEVK